MKFSFKKREEGSMLLICMIVCIVVGILLASYLTLIQTRSTLTVRSQDWNAAIPVLEAGIEEALTHLHADTNNPGANGWTSTTVNGIPVYTKQRNFTDHSYFQVTIYNADSTTNCPLIYSQGFVPSPLKTNQYISRTVQVGMTNTVTFTKAIAAKNTVTIGSSSIVDSFNSSDTNYSTGGLYDPAKRQTNGGVVTDSHANPAINVGNGNIYGPVNTGSGGTVSIGNGSVGSVGPHDMNVAYPDQVLPSPWSALPVNSGAVGGTSYTYVVIGTSSGPPAQYQMPGFSMTGGNTMIITGHAILYVTGDITLKGSSSIYLAPGASLDLYAGGATTDFGGGGIVNSSGLAANFSYHGLPSNTSITYHGNVGFIGTINAPEAAFTMSGTPDLFGACIVDSFSGNGNNSVHYDEGLSAFSHLVVTSYREL